MNKAIKYLGFSFFGALLLLVLGAAGPIFIPVQNGAGNATKFTNAVAVSNFFSLDTSGAKTNLEIDGGDAAHFYPQTSAQGIITFGDPSLATGLWGLWSKPAGLFMMGNGGTTEFQINMANGTTFINGPQTNNNNLDMNGSLQTWDGAGNKVLQFGNDPVNPKILSRGIGLQLQSQIGNIMNLNKVTNADTVDVTGLLSAYGGIDSLGTGGSVIAQTASNGVGMVVLKPDPIMTTVITNFWPTNLASPGQILTAYITNALGVFWAWSNAPAASQTPWASDINGAGFSLSNVFKLSLGTNGYSGTQNPSFILGGTNSAGTGTMFKMANTNGQLEVRSGSNTTFSASLPMSLTAAGAMTLNQGLTLGNSSTLASSAGYLALSANNATIYFDGASVGDIGVQHSVPHKFFVSTNAEYAFFDSSSAIQSAFRSQVNGVVELNSGTYGVYRDLILRTLTATNVILNASIAAPAAPANAGALVWTDGTNLCAVFKNAGGTLTTNKFTMSAWP